MDQKRMAFHELDTVDFFVDKENNVQNRSPSLVGDQGDSDSNDGVLVNCIQNWDLSSDITLDRDTVGSLRTRTRRPPLIRKPKHITLHVNHSDTLEKPSRFSTAFNAFLAKSSADHQEPVDRRTTTCPQCFVHLLSSELVSHTEQCRPRPASSKSSSLDLETSRVCRNCRLFFPTLDALQTHVCHNKADSRSSHFPSSKSFHASVLKNCLSCGAVDKIGYFCSRCGCPLTSSSSIKKPAAAASKSPIRFPPAVHVRRSPIPQKRTTSCHSISRRPLNDHKVETGAAQPTKNSLPKVVECPHCWRKFSRSAADRHIDICSNVINKPSPLRRPTAALSRKLSIIEAKPVFRR
uniref:Uncharacterized protein n=1 Tax=Spongospora subterranea TaxID=70186 RepID=A0A0H5RCD6_9EUKA|eukprot:CRZ11262.1 hypothetical protein [Spongospora subterranea]